MIAKGEPLAATADRLCREMERLIPGVICSVLLVDAGGRIRPLAAPSLPPDHSAALDGLSIDLQVGPSGSTAGLGRPAAVSGIAADPPCAELGALGLPPGMLACWSNPICDGQGKVVGTFAFYCREKRDLGPAECRAVQTCVHLCAIAIERHQRVLDRERRAYVDDLTGLSNRAAFDAALSALPCDEPGSWALLITDLDNLKVVNDTFGHAAGDCLLQAVARRLAATARPDRVYRLGGDEFAILLRSPAALHDMETTAARILEALKPETDCGGHLVAPRATLGGAMLASTDRNAETVRQNADFALYHAKETGRGGFVRYWPGIGTTIMRRMAAVRDVEAALREDRIEAHYQPVVNLATRQIVGVEALCRMRLGDRVVPAGGFQEALADAHIAREITARMLAFAAADLRSWLDLGGPLQHVGINVSSVDFLGGQLEREVSAAFGKHGVPLHHVVLEVTEAVYMGERGNAIRQAIAALRAKGLFVALDDFGTGFASLTHLLAVPVDTLKIDKSFVAQLTPGSPGAAIIEGILFISRKLGMHIVAEGIEREDQAEQLRAFGCTLGQGFLYSRPLDSRQLTALLERGAGRADAVAAPSVMSGRAA